MPKQAASSDVEASILPSGESPSDEALMANIGSGDRTAFEQLYDRHVPIIYALCLKILHRDSEAEAVVSDVFFGSLAKTRQF